MREHLGRIGLLLVSLCMVGLLIATEYKREVATEEAIYFQVGEEVIQTWKKDGIHYLFLPSYANMDNVKLTPYSPEFYILSDKKKISRGEMLGELPNGEVKGCQFTDSKKIFRLCILQSEELPAMFLETRSGGLEELKADKEYEVSGTVTIIDKDGSHDSTYGVKALGGRGNTSFAGYDKKPFSITLNGTASLMGLPSGEKYALISNASDPSLIRNDLVRRMEVEMGLPYSHTGCFVDLYVNGEYEGNYYLCDDIEIGRERININNMETYMDRFYRTSDYEGEEIYETVHSKARVSEVNPVDISGGYLMEREYVQRFEHEYEMISSAFITDAKEHFVVKNPKYCSAEQIEYIYKYVNEAEKAILSPAGINQDTGKGYEEYIDIDSFVKKYLAEEVSKNYDGGVSSSYYYKNSDLNGSKLCAAPGWDYDMSLGNYVDWMEEFSSNPEGISQLSHHTYASSWYTNLYQKEDFYERVVEVYVSKLSPYLDLLVEEGIDGYEEMLRASSAMNEVRWADELQSNPYYKNREQTFEDLKAFLAERKAFLDEAWKKETTQ